VIRFESCPGAPVERKIVSDVEVMVKREADDYCYEVVQTININESLYSTYLAIKDAVDTRAIRTRSDVDAVFYEEASRYKLDRTTASMLLRLLKLERMEFGILTPLFYDEDIEDIQVNGVDSPVYVMHSKYGRMRTNIVIESLTYLRNYTQSLMQKAGRPVTYQIPINDGMLSIPGRGFARITAGLESVSLHGPYFSVRLQKPKPILITDMISKGTVPPELASLVWLLLESRGNVMIFGGTGSGKTTLLNALAVFVASGRIVVIEEVPELTLPKGLNVLRLVAKPTYKVFEEERGVELYDLLKQALRMIPDVIVVGEVRGEEGHLLMQAINSGHGALSTFHGESIQQVVFRLTGKAIGITPDQLVGLQLFIYVSRRETKAGVVRRVTSVVEVVPKFEDFPFGVDLFEELPVRFNEIMRYDWSKGSYVVDLRRSYLVHKLARQFDLSVDDVLDELENRKEYLLKLSLRRLSVEELIESIRRYSPERAEVKVIEV